MATQTFSAPIAGFKGEQLSLGTTITSIGFPPGVEEVMLNANDAFYPQFAPRIIKCCKTADSGVTFTDYTPQARDRDTSTVVDLSSLDTAANGDYWYLAAKFKFEGATLTIGAGDSGAGVMTGYYWNGSAWADASITDNTACLASTNTITWTRASAWATTTLDGVSGLYVIRFQTTVALDTEVEIDEIALLPNITDNAAGYCATSTDYVMTLDVATNGALAASSAGASKTLNITWMRHTKFGNG